MSHPYAEFEGTDLWGGVDAALADLERNRDLKLTTARTHVVGYLCRVLTRQGLAVRDANHSVPVVLSPDEALVLFDLLARGGDVGSVVIEHPAEEHVLWRLEGALERKLVTPLDPYYESQLAAARERIAGGSQGESDSAAV